MTRTEFYTCSVFETQRCVREMEDSGWAVRQLMLINDRGVAGSIIVVTYEREN